MSDLPYEYCVYDRHVLVALRKEGFQVEKLADNLSHWVVSDFNLTHGETYYCAETRTTLERLGTELRRKGMWKDSISQIDRITYHDINDPSVVDVLRSEDYDCIKTCFPTVYQTNFEVPLALGAMIIGYHEKAGFLSIFIKFSKEKE